MPPCELVNGAGTMRLFLPVQDEKRPEALLASGDGEVAAQLSQLKGQMNAIEQAIIDKQCAIQRSAPPATK
jgi:hypothetical protein